MIKFKRLLKIFTVPFMQLHAALNPVAYARRVGVKMNGKVTIYGSSYRMFSAEPYLVTLDDNVFISVDARFICHDGGVLPFRREYPDLDLAAPIHIGSDTFIGAGATILKGVTIGSRSIVAAGAMVTKSFPPRLHYRRQSGTSDQYDGRLSGARDQELAENRAPVRRRKAQALQGNIQC